MNCDPARATCETQTQTQSSRRSLERACQSRLSFNVTSNFLGTFCVTDVTAACNGWS